MSRITETVKTLLIANALFFLGSQIVGDIALKYFALWYPQNPNFQIWQVISHMFMHSDITHILFNMFALFIFGSVLEINLGQKRFLFLYFSAGLGAAFLQILFNYIGFQDAYQSYIESGITPDQIQSVLDSAVQTGQYRTYGISSEISTKLLTNYIVPMVGASGAIFGVVAAFAVLFPNMPLYIMFIPVPIKAKYLVGGYFALNVVSALTGSSLTGPDNTAYWAHIGGAVIGFLTMRVWKNNGFNQNRWN